MKYSTRGFSLLEVLIVTLISALLAGVLFTTFWQTQQLEINVIEIVGVDQTVARLYNQLEKDINGFVLPAVSMTATSTAQPAAHKKSEETSKVAKIFVSTLKDGSLDTLMFITNNVLSVYNKQKPLLARVVYRLQPSTDYEHAFTLTRQEYATLDARVLEEKNKQPQAYMIADGIKELVCTYQYEEKPTDKEGRTAERKKITVSAWDSDTIEQEKDTKQPLVPTQIEVKLVLLEPTSDQAQTFTFTFPLLVAPGVDSMRKQKPVSVTPPPPVAPPPAPSPVVRGQIGGKGTQVNGTRPSTGGINVKIAF